MSKMQFETNEQTGELTITKEIAAPIEKVWEAYTSAAVFEQWWGPNGWSTSVKECKVEAGGTLLYIMKCEDEAQGEWFGQESCGKMVFDEVQKPELITYTDYFCDAEGNITEGMPATKSVMRFEATETGTKIINIGTYESAEALKQVLDMGMEAGIEQTMDRLEVLLTSGN